MRELTTRQRRILDWVRAFRAKHGMPPTVREIGRHFRIASSSVFAHLKLIEKKGHLRRGKLGARSLDIHEATPAVPASEPLPSSDGDLVAIPEVGRVAAGMPLLAQESIEGTIKVDRALLRGPRDARHFSLRVAGDSMVEAGILDGDRVIVRQQSTAADGQIVVALLDDEATVKRFFKEDGRVRLQPANSRMGPIYAREVAVQGVVVGVLRTYS
jgi:repressor LexA